MNMLRLLGFEFANRNMTRATTDDGKLDAMRDGRQRLTRATGQDFGFDVAAWRDFLIERGEDFGYTHPYAYRTVDRAVRKWMADGATIALLESLAANEPNA
jgi:hypothetical protein